MQVRILKCSNSNYWYSKYIGDVFTVCRSTRTEFWTKEPGMYKCNNFVLKTDCEVIVYSEESRLFLTKKES